MEFKIKAEDVKRDAEGRWESILRSLAPALHPALERVGKHVRCPVHGGANDFRLFKDVSLSGGGICTCNTRINDGFSLLMWINGWTFRETLFAVAEELGYDTSSPEPRQYKPRVDQAELERRERERKAEAEARNVKLKASLNRVWEETLPAKHPDAEPLRLYLARRGMTIGHIPATLRFHPELPYVDDDRRIVGYFPTLVAMVQGLDGKAITLHRIYLTPDGRKAPVKSPKKLMAYPSDRNLNGAAIRLGVVEEVMAVTEGIETGLAVQQSTGIPTWVTISANLMETLQVPDSVDMVCIYADKDKSETGRDSASILVQRMWEEGRKATGLLPSFAIPDAEKGLDWLDVFNQYGPDQIPTLARVREMLRMNAARKRRAAF